MVVLEMKCAVIKIETTVMYTGMCVYINCMCVLRAVSFPLQLTYMFYKSTITCTHACCETRHATRGNNVTVL